MILLKNKILKNILLRRTKIGRAADLALPPRIVSFPMLSVHFLIQKDYIFICTTFLLAGFVEEG